jgi:hypothetical protein
MVFSFARLAAVAAAEDDADVSFGNFGNFIVETFAFVGALAAAPFALSKLALTASFPGALRGIETAALLLMTLLTLYGEKARVHVHCLFQDFQQILQQPIFPPRFPGTRVPKFGAAP